MAVGGVGLRYHLNEKWAIATEVTYRHISNAGATERNPRAEFGRRPARRKLFLPLKSSTTLLPS
jgi:hypothetical protein